MHRFTQQPTELEHLERRRDQLVERLTRVCRDPSPDVVEGFEFDDWHDASLAKGEVTQMLIHAIETINALIRELIVAPLSPRLAALCAHARTRTAHARVAGRVMAGIGGAK